MSEWLDAKSGFWSLANLTLPGGEAECLYELIARNPSAPLPEEDAGAKLKWAAGALDGVMGHHGELMGGQAEPGEGAVDIDRTLDSLRALLTRSSNSNLAKLYAAVCQAPILGYVDRLLPAIEAEFTTEKARLAAIARLFVLKAPRREPVKFGTALLGLAGSASDVEALLTLGTCDEFTLFAAVAIQRLSPAYERELWDLAKTVDGWGRIHLVERLAETEDFEIRAWLLREGHRNCIMSEYVACICARAGKRHEALRASPTDAGLLESATDLIQALMEGGPAENIDDYEHAAEATEGYLDAVWVQGNRRPPTFVVVDQIREWLTSDDGWEERSKCGWNPVNRERCLQQSRELLSQEGWKEEAIKDLASTDRGAFSWANEAARKLGIEHVGRPFRQSGSGPHHVHLLVRPYRSDGRLTNRSPGRLRGASHSA